MVRLQIVLNPEEASYLERWARSELRDPRDQILYILRLALEREMKLETEENFKSEFITNEVHNDN